MKSPPFFEMEGSAERGGQRYQKVGQRFYGCPTFYTLPIAALNGNRSNAVAFISLVFL